MTAPSFRAIPHANDAYDRAKAGYAAAPTLENAQTMIAAERALASVLFDNRRQISAWARTGRG